MGANATVNNFETASNPWRVALLSLIFATVAFGTDMYLPAFPAIGRAFGAAAEQVQNSLTVFLYGNALGQLVYGPLSDRFGRRPVLLAGLAAYTLASFGCMFAEHIAALLAFRAVQGLASAAGPVLVRALINDCMDRVDAAKMLAMLIGYMAFIAMLTPIIGGWLVAQGSWQWIFAFIGATGSLLVILAWRSLPETLQPARRLPRLGVVEVATGYIDVARRLAFWCYVLPPSLMFTTVFAYVGANSFLLIERLGMSEQTHGLVYALAACAYVAGSFASNRLVHVLGVERALTAGLMLGLSAAGAAVSASSLLPPSVLLVVLPGMATFFATAMIVPVAQSTAVSLFPARAGTASAVAGCTQVIAAGVGTGLAARFVSGEIFPLHVLTLLCAILATTGWLIARRRVAGVTD